MQRETQKPKYAQLELSLSKISGSYENPKELGHMVIRAYALAPLTGKTYETAIANMLHLEETPRRELKELHDNMLTPIHRYLESIRPMVVHGFMNVNNGKETRRLKAEGFGELYSNAYDSEELKDREHIKRVIVYPLFISTLNTWRKYDSEFSTQLIGIIKSKEKSAELREFIDLLDSTPVARNFMRN